MEFMISIEKLVQGLKGIPDEAFTCEGVYGFLRENSVAAESLEPYVFWSPNYYTRNLIHKDERFEMLVICWEIGQASRIHDHWDQKCWMTVPVGRLSGQNFRVMEMDPSRNYCKLEETDSFELADYTAAAVDLEAPVHQILNLDEYRERAVSIHIYSKPYDRCHSFCRDTDTYKEVLLSYTSIGGKLCDGVSL